MTDFARWPEWTASVTSIEREGEGAMAPGAKVMIRQPRLPPALWVMQSLEPGAGFTWKSGMPGLWVVARHSIAPVAGGTRVTLSIEFLGLLGGLAARLTRDLNERYLAMESAGLKRRCEEAPQL